MTALLWAMLAGVALLWPSRLAGPLDGAPLDQHADALIIGLALPALFAIDRGILKLATIRVAIVALLLWKSLLFAAIVRDGWCVKFTSPAPLFVENVTVPHAWDVRADWRSGVPRCTAVVTRPYRALDEFPVWFYNLPPATWLEPATDAERPPFVTTTFDVSGALQAATSGVLRIETGEHDHLSIIVDGKPREEAFVDGVPLSAGTHDIRITGKLSGDRWRFVPLWNGRDLWQSSLATMTPMSSIDRWLRPWGRWISPLLIAAMLVVSVAHVARRASNLSVIAAASAQAALAIAVSSRVLLMRVMPLVAAAALVLRVPRRLQNVFGAQLLVGIPFLVLVAARSIDQVGRAMWYTTGDDWWMFQRYAYRIYLQGFWLEGGEPSFWFQPFYRWIAGALHMMFGDSSIGEFFWDGACGWAGALFAFHVVRTVAGFRWGIAAAVTTLAVMTLGPGWYLFGRGLSEISSAGFAYAAALFAMRGRRSAAFLCAAGACVVLAFYTRLNNLPFAAAIAAFSLPLSYQAGDWWRWRQLWARVSRQVFAGIAAAVVIAIVLFSARAYYYTGNINALSGTQASARSVWQPSAAGESTAENVMGSVLMVMTMSDPPTWEPRALPLVAGIVAAVLALAGVPRFRQLPLNVCVLCLAGLVGAFVARGSAYPGRFSIHLIPVTVALTMSAVAIWSGRARGARA